MTRLAIAVMAVLVAAAPVALAHELRPAYLDLREQEPGVFAVLFKTPMRGDLRLAVAPELSGQVESISPMVDRRVGDASIRTWTVRAADGLRGNTVRIDGLEATMTDALVRIEFADGSSWTHRLTARAPSADVPRSASALDVARVYAELGVEHILLGIDHILFVLALLLVTRGTKRVVTTITAFTLAHSMTLAAAALGIVHVPSAPVEAAIALSIVLVAAEIVRARAGAPGVTARAPWVVAFTFGLLHGLGFAGALSDIGLPHGQVPAALLWFNIGVELGQLLFVAVVLALVAVVRRVRVPLPRSVQLVPPYAIGGVATFWLIERTLAF